MTELVKKMKHKLYALVDINNPTDIRYIGQTKEPLDKRLYRHLRDTKSNQYKSNWIRKSGKENIHIHLMQDNIPTELINDMERDLIKVCKEIGYRLTNITDGGEGWNGMKFTEEHRLNISKNHHNVSGENNPMYGKTHSKQTMDIIKDKIYNWNSTVGFSEEQRRKFSIVNRGENNNNSTITESQVKEIRTLSELGFSKKYLSEKFNCSTNLIHKVVMRYTWKHI